MKRGLAIAGATALVLAAAGCSSDSGSESDDKKVNITQFRLHTAATTLVAQNKGIAESYGLEVNNGWGESSAAMVAALAGGQTDVATSSAPSVIEAITNGNVDLKIIGEVYREQPGETAYVALPGSGIKEIKDLIGKKVAIPGMSNSSVLRLKYTMKKQGLDYNKVEFVDMPHGEMTASLERGAVDVAQLTSSTLAAAIDTLDTTVVYDVSAGEFDGFPALAWVASGKFVKENPDAVAAFQCAVVVEGAQAVLDDKDLYREQLKSGLDWDDAAIDAVINTRYSPTSDAEVLQQVPDIMQEVGVLKEKFDVSDIVVPLPSDCDSLKTN